MPSNRFSLTDYFGPANASIARINRICKDARRNMEAHQNGTIENRETPTLIPSRDSGESIDFASRLAPHTKLTVIKGGK